MFYVEFTTAAEAVIQEAVEQAQADHADYLRRGFTGDEAAIYVSRGIAPPSWN